MTLVVPRLSRYASLFGAVMLALFLAACSGLPPRAEVTDQPPDFAGCCERAPNAPDIPPWVIKLGQAIPQSLVRSLLAKDMRPGHMDDQDAAKEFVFDTLEPLDIILVRTGGRVSSRFTPGHFGHALIYMGNEEQLRGLGVWNSPWLTPHRAAFEEWPAFLQAIGEGTSVDCADPGVADEAAIFRPRLQGRASRVAKLREGLSLVGRPFDFEFDADDPSKLFCIELVAVLMPDLNLPLRKIAGRQTYIPDDVAVQALAPETPFDLVTYVEADRVRWRASTEADLAARIRAKWPDEDARRAAAKRTLSQPLN